MASPVYLWGLRIGTLFSGVAWILIVYNIDPDKSGLQGLALFYSSFFLVVVGLITTMLFWTRRSLEGDEDFHSQMGMSFREGILAAALAVLLLVMQRAEVLVWWDGLLVLAGIFLIELFFLGRHRIKHKL